MPLSVEIHPVGAPLGLPLIFTVIYVRCQGQWLLVRHRERSTWECPGGHIDPGEDPLDAAARELYEESGLRCALIPVCDYLADDRLGRAFYAVAPQPAALPKGYETAETRLFPEPPENLTYPGIYRALFPVIEEAARALDDMSFEQSLAISMELWERHRETWSPMDAPHARNSLLWLMSELGEVIDIVKKSGEALIMSDPAVRAALVEELCDVHMYFNDVLNRYAVTPGELSVAYRAKHMRNMRRDYDREAAKYLARRKN